MNNNKVKEFFQSIETLNLSKSQKKRMLKLFQVRGSNKVNRAMSYLEFKKHLKTKNGNITSLVFGPKWNRLVFVDIDIEV